MLTTIKTSLLNKSVVTDLTYKLQLGPENIIARMAFAYSIATSENLNIKNIKDSKGKEYSIKILFGNYHVPIYVALLCQKYNISNKNKDIQKYIKMHVDDGLEKLSLDYSKKAINNSFDFFLDKIEAGLSYLSI